MSWERALTIAERVVTIAENYWNARTRQVEAETSPVHDAEVWKKGERKEAETREEYEKLPRQGEGKFTRLYRAANPTADD